MIKTLTATNQRLLFISDVHLSPDHPSLYKTFQRFLETEAAQADALFILGDLFDYWLGDDLIDGCNIEHHKTTLAQLAIIGNQMPIYIQHGNTDFLLGERFSAHTNTLLIDDPCLLTLGSHRVLLMHGDGACEADSHYLNTRKIRHQIVAPLLQLPANERLAKALALRSHSANTNQSKSADLFRPPIETLERLLAEHQCQQIVHGHTHCPGESSYNNGLVNVLGKWKSDGACIAVYEPNDIIRNFYWTP